MALSLRCVLLGSLVLASCGGAAPPGAAAPETSAPPSAASMMAPEDPGGAVPDAQPVGGEPSAGDDDLVEGPNTASSSRTTSKRDEDREATPAAPVTTTPAARPLAAVSTAAAGKVGRGELEAVVASNLDRFRPCATEDASVELEVTVSGGGSVTGVKALRSRPDNAKLRDCVVEAFRGIAFKRGAGSETSTITFELALNRPAF